jgi:hypothetical protein
MDAARQHIKQNRNRRAAMQAGIVLFFVFTVMPCCQGQQLGIRSRDGNQEIVHDLLHNQQFFKEVQWDIHNSFQNQGVAVIWTAEAFQSGGSLPQSNNFADTGLSVRILNSGPKDAWQISQPTDVTEVVRGDRSAMVSAVSNQHSEATFGITVMFRCSANAIPVAGRYETLLIGTLAAP